MNKNIELVMIASAACLLSACGLQEKVVNFLEIGNQINKAIMENCRCDMTANINYEISASGRHGSVQIVGSEIASKASAAKSIALALEKNVPDFCKFDEFGLEFINKGHSEVFSVRHCKVSPGP